MSADQLSPVSTLCLAILHHGEATGYEIKKGSVEGDYRYFVDASYGSIYPALSRLANEGYVTVREETQAGRPARKVYAITETGHRALVDALSREPGPDLFRSRFLLVAKFAAELPEEVVRDAIDQRRKNLRDELAHLERIEKEACENPAVGWITGYGRSCMTASLDYLDANRDRLIAMARQDIPQAAE
ncbi:PadR family transcriptional regulator [Acuticoccus sp. M5D2P5]|uniref:PadR family transcriptional regulator n=1 Tax=Acuticoccus kalidii TaxID=2910977 RepID=UPI001F18F03A|nr:PadR family transcriptional regulator [Acuticoccus kalidii]MCF3935138.1 PadR family transcriptional regulator [Acuticoccus kalidii]